MKNHSIKNISEILENSSLAKIVQRANQLNELNEKIQSLLPVQFRKLYRIVNLVENRLIIEVPNATISQGLQLQQMQLLTMIQTVYPEVNECVFKINPDFKYG
nr:DciA family protein [uncultured Haemophilus sp.]